MSARGANACGAAGSPSRSSLGVPGPVERAKLLGMAGKIGVGESLRFLRKQRSVFARLAAPGGFSTDRFVRPGARPCAANPALGIEGLHVFTFNQVAEVTEGWRQRTCSRRRWRLVAAGDERRERTVEAARAGRAHRPAGARSARRPPAASVRSSARSAGSVVCTSQTTRV